MPDSGQDHTTDGNDSFLESRPVKKEKVLTISQALNLIKQRGYIIKDDVGPVT